MNGSWIQKPDVLCVLITSASDLMQFEGWSLSELVFVLFVHSHHLLPQLKVGNYHLYINSHVGLLEGFGLFPQKIEDYGEMMTCI
ncbi:hypothetical protein RIF29_31535 [Crotalaria pallida]|uniref:Uncharacterized protein n=1 Tax=Crotalaria pallida TaxID=3830 RepID=A0AAN9EI39_CROPI